MYISKLKNSLFQLFYSNPEKEYLLLKIFAQRSQCKAIRGHKSCQTLRIVHTEAAYPGIVQYLKIIAISKGMSKF